MKRPNPDRAGRLTKVAILSALSIKESFGKDLDFLET
jgi:hypothetical protein